MTVYFDFKANIKSGIEFKCVEWHLQLPFLAVGYCVPDPLQSFVTVLNQLGEPLPDLDELCENKVEITSLAWHPSKKVLVAGFSTGGIRLWNGQPDFLQIPSTHSSPIRILKWSELGTRLVSVDQSGVLVGWKEENPAIICRLYECSVPSQPLTVDFCCAKPGLDINVLAKKAVAGDEKALDIFSAWRPKTGTHRPTFSVDNVSFYLASVPDKIHHVDENGNVTNVTSCKTDIKRMLHHRNRELLIAILDDGTVNQYATSTDGKLQNINKVKLNDVSNDAVFIWAGDDWLVCTTSRYAVRFFEINTGDTYVLAGTATSPKENEIFTTISYLPARGILCGGSNNGNVSIWKRNSNNLGIGGNEWEELSTTKMKEKISYSCWGFENCAILSADNLFVLQDHELCSQYNKQVCAIQRSANEVFVTHNENSANLNTDLKIIGVAVSEEHVAVWSGKTVAVYNLTDLTTLNVLGTFNCECETVLIYELSLIILPSSSTQTGKMQITTLQGTVKQTLDSDGRPVMIYLNQNYLVAATVNGIIHIWDVSRREAKMHVHPKALIEDITDFGEVVMVRVNCVGTLVSITIANSNLIPTHFIYVWDTETDTMMNYYFEHSDNQNFEEQKYITNHYWDANEPFLLVCETKISEKNDNNYSKIIPDDIPLSPKIKKRNFLELATFFVSKECGMVIQDIINVSSSYVKLLGVDVPYFINLKKSVTDVYACMEKLLMNYFDEESVNDPAVKSALVKFSFNLSLGNLDEAYKTIININNKNIWTNLAKMCVTKGRLDVARVCLGHMQDAVGVATLRELEDETSTEVKLAALAIHLEMLDEAERLYKSIKRYDLLNQFYRLLNRWDDAISLAEEKNRINLKNTYDNYGRHLESRGLIQEAIEMYEKANTHRKHVPRLLLPNPVALEKYVQKSKDPVLMKWWAQYVESTRNMELAMKYYEEAKDYLSKVRILCFLEKTDEAAAVANATDDPAACYYLARHYENLGQIDNAINFFLKSGVFMNAIRICKENGLDDQLWDIALFAGCREKLDSAKYFESVDPYRAVILYQKAENIYRAIQVAFKYNLEECIEQISCELSPNNDAELLQKCAQYFINKENFDAAVKLLASARNYDRAISICNKRKIRMTEELADLLTPDQKHPNRVEIINQLGEFSFLSANYHLAAKKFTQAGNKVKAMKALLKSGDTEKIIFFANVSREKEIYIMAANYLQTLDWQMQPEYLKHIINFYTKGKAPHLLANFYVACAQIEVDDYGNYEKSVGALNEASRCLSKDPDQYGQALEYIAKKMTSVKKFLDLRRQFEKNDGEAAMLQCRQMLNSDLDLVRRGDIYSLMIEFLIKNDDWNGAAQIANEMKKNIPIENLIFYVPEETLRKIGIELPKRELRRTDTVVDDIEDISQEVQDDI